MRVRFHPQNGQLYACGMFAWAGNQTEPGGFYRVRYTGKPVHLPIGLHARRRRHADHVQRPAGPADGRGRGELRRPNLEYPPFGQLRFGPLQRDALTVTRATLSADGKTVTLQIPQIKPTWCMEIKFWLKGSGGETVHGTIHNTIHRLE